MLMLAWMANAFHAAAGAINHRHARQRAHFSVRRLAHRVRGLAILRAIYVFEQRHRPLWWRERWPSARPGFARRTAPPNHVRAIFGAALRKRLAARTPLARIGQLMQALRDLDRLAARVAKRIQSWLTRICPILLVRPPHDAPAPRLVVAAAAINSS